MNETTWTLSGQAFTVVYSPDDNGYWINQFDINRERNRASKRVYATRAEAARALTSNKVKWEKWD